MESTTNVQEQVKEKYGSAARAVAESELSRGEHDSPRAPSDIPPNRLRPRTTEEALCESGPIQCHQPLS